MYYSSIILYLGAVFTKTYAIGFGAPIAPNDYAVTVKQVEIETDKNTLQKNENLTDASVAKIQQATVGLP